LSIPVPEQEGSATQYFTLEYYFAVNSSSRKFPRFAVIAEENPYLSTRSCSS